MRRMIAFYEAELARVGERLPTGDHRARARVIDELIDNDPTKISWTVNLKAELARGTHLAFDDTRFWNAALEGLPDESHELTERYGAVSASPMHSAFCEVALFFAWHVAQTHPVAARVLFAMPDAVAARLLDAPLCRIRRVAIDYPGLLTPRWTRNPVFWPDLIRLASSADARLEAAQLHGSQLIACELDGSLPPAARSPAGLRRRRQSP